jgi:hypothetical protein
MPDVGAGDGVSALEQDAESREEMDQHASCDVRHVTSRGPERVMTPAGG